MRVRSGREHIWMGRSSRGPGRCQEIELATHSLDFSDLSPEAHLRNLGELDLTRRWVPLALPQLSVNPQSSQLLSCFSASLVKKLQMA